ncbi:MAG: 6-phosphofructokinase, partial [Candidatus Latescibacteria bacterium]|nr:6-phosphofructokinase [Candidatus Latescibacterota bacterium]
KVVGAPKTIDNDVSGTDYTFGFDTAINRTMESLDRLQSTTVSHQRVTVVEIMGRHAGWIALHGGIAGGANWITIPEVEFDVKEIAEMIKARYAAGKKWALIAVAEGSIDPDLQRRIQHSAETDDFGHVQFSISQGVAKVVADELEELTGFESRHTVLGHLQRGGEPSAFDRVLGTRLGVKVVEMIRESNFGKMAAVQGGEGDHIVPVDLEVGVGTSKTVPLKDYEVAKLFFG